MTGSASDPLDWQPHIRNKPRREALAPRFRDPADPFRIVIVRDMWLTGFDAPSLHTMYVDKPMRGHGLMQAIARVNRVFKDKPGGLVVDYLGLADELKQALATYTEAGGTGETALDQAEAVALMLEKYEVCRGLSFHAPSTVRASTGAAGRPARRRIACRCCPRRRSTSWRRRTARRGCCAPSPSCRRPSRWRCRTRRRCASATTWASSRRCARCSPRARPASARPTRSWTTPSARSSPGRWSPDEVVDIFAAAGLKKPDISILSDEFLAEVRGMPQRNLAVELLQKLLKGEIRARGQAQRRPGALVRRAAGAGHPQVPEPRHRDRPGDRGADPAREGHARGRAPAARSSG